MARPPCSCSIRRMSRESLVILIQILILIQIQNVEPGGVNPTSWLCIIRCEILGRGNRGNTMRGPARACI